MIESATNTVKIVGFSFSCSSQGRPLSKGGRGRGFNTTLLGNANFLAPEIVNQEPYYGPNVDIYALAVILFYLITGRLPFAKANA